MSLAVLTEQGILDKTKCKSLTEVRHLDMWGEALTDVSIVGRLSRIQVLGLAVNQINTLKPFAQCPTLEELYLRKNQVADLKEVAALGALKKLRTLWLMDNPCAKHPLYREYCLHCCQGIKQLDNVEVTAEERAAAEKKMTSEALESIQGVATISRPRVPPSTAAPDVIQRPLSSSSVKLSNNNAAVQGKLRKSSNGSNNCAASAAAAAAASASTQQQDAASSAVIEERGASGKTVLFTTVQAQRAMLTAIVSLLPELTAESLELLDREVHERVEKQRKLKAAKK